jgi:hypothetical protein
VVPPLRMSTDPGMSDIALLTILGGIAHPMPATDETLDVLANQARPPRPTFDENGELARLVIDTLSSKR